MLGCHLSHFLKEITFLVLAAHFSACRTRIIIFRKKCRTHANISWTFFPSRLKMRVRLWLRVRVLTLVPINLSIPLRLLVNIGKANRAHARLGCVCQPLCIHAPVLMPGIIFNYFSRSPWDAKRCWPLIAFCTSARHFRTWGSAGTHSAVWQFAMRDGNHGAKNNYLFTQVRSALIIFWFVNN